MVKGLLQILLPGAFDEQYLSNLTGSAQNVRLRGYS